MGYNPPVLKESPALLHHGPLGRTSKGGRGRGEEKEGGEAARRDGVNDSEEEDVEKASESRGH